MIVTVDEMKNYLRVDFSDDDKLLEDIIAAAEKQCMDIVRIDNEEDFAKAVHISEMELLTIGTLLDMYSEMKRDDEPHAALASQDDMDRF